MIPVLNSPVHHIFQFLLPFLMPFLDMWIDALTAPFSKYCLGTLEGSWNSFRGTGIFFVYFQQNKNSAAFKIEADKRIQQSSIKPDMEDRQKCKTVYSSC